MSLNVATPPRTKAEAVKRVLVFDDFNRFSGVLRELLEHGIDSRSYEFRRNCCAGAWSTLVKPT